MPTKKKTVRQRIKAFLNPPPPSMSSYPVKQAAKRYKATNNVPASVKVRAIAATRRNPVSSAKLGIQHKAKKASLIHPKSRAKTSGPVVGARTGFNSVTPKSASPKLTYNAASARTAPSGDYDAMYPMAKTASMVAKRAKPAVKYAPLKMKVTAREVPRETWAQRSAKYQQGLAKQRMIKASRS